MLVGPVRFPWTAFCLSSLSFLLHCSRPASHLTATNPASHAHPPEHQSQALCNGVSLAELSVLIGTLCDVDDRVRGPDRIRSMCHDYSSDLERSDVIIHMLFVGEIQVTGCFVQ